MNTEKTSVRIVPEGYHVHQNGGGLVHDSASVPASAYVGKSASVGESAIVCESASRPIEIPIIPRIDSAILAAVNREGCALKMSSYHSCETTHCRAGWAIHLTGEKGYALEKLFGPWVAGAAIYRASRPKTPTPDFYASDEAAMEDMKTWAAKEVAS